jgi:hypothetical protein
VSDEMEAEEVGNVGSEHESVSSESERDANCEDDETKTDNRNGQHKIREAEQRLMT